MILEVEAESKLSANSVELNEYTMRYELGNRKLKSLESDLEKLNIVIKDKEKIIGLYEFMLNNTQRTTVVTDAR